MKKIILAVSLLVAIVGQSHAMTAALTSPIYSGPISSTQTINVDLNAARVDFLSVTASYSSATLSASAFTDGALSSVNITVNSTTTLAGVASTDFVNVLTTNGLTAAQITINGNPIYNNGWRVNFASFTAIDIVTEVNAQPGYGVTASTSTSTQVKLTCIQTGTFCNNFTLAIVGTSSLTVTGATFSGGTDAGVLVVNGQRFIAGVNYALGTTAVTATNIAAAMNANSVLSGIVISTAPNGSAILYSTATTIGINNYSVTISTPGNHPVGLTLSSNVYTGGSASAVQTSNNSLNLPSHGLANGTQVLFAKSAGTPPGVLISGTTYFAVVLDANDVQLASTLANATATPAVIVGISTQTTNGGGSFTLSPLAIASPLLLTWNASDDGVNFNPLTLPNNVTPTTITVAVTSGQASTYWDFGQINARYLQLKAQGPTAGAFNLTVTPYGKSQANGY